MHILLIYLLKFVIKNSSYVYCFDMDRIVEKLPIGRTRFIKIKKTLLLEKKKSQSFYQNIQIGT